MFKQLKGCIDTILNTESNAEQKKSYYFTSGTVASEPIVSNLSFIAEKNQIENNPSYADNDDLVGGLDAFVLDEDLNINIAVSDVHNSRPKKSNYFTSGTVRSEPISIKL